MQKHLEFQIITPRTLTNFKGQTLVLPDVRVLSQAERGWLQKYVAQGKQLVITGEDATQLGELSNVVRLRNCPGKAYTAALESDFEHTLPDSQAAFFKSLQVTASMEIIASPKVAAYIARVEGKPYIFFANFAGLRAGINPVQTPQTGVRVAVSKEARGRSILLGFPE